MVITDNTGFTMIEVLIIIVVIGILSSVIVVGYRSTQLRERNSQTAYAVRTYKDALELYRTQNDSYPSRGKGDGSTCLGDNYPTAKCWLDTATTDTSFMNALSNIIKDRLPMPAMPDVTLKGIMFMPASVGTKLDGIPTDFLVYSIEGNGVCPVGTVAQSKGFNFITPAPESGQSYARTADNPAQCWIGLPSAG